MIRLICCISFLLLSTCAIAQQQVVVADAITAEALPFATIKHGEARQGIITDINGKFVVPAGTKQLTVSYIGHQAKTVSAPFGDTIFLDIISNSISEVVIKPPFDKIKRIVNLAVQAKDSHNPDKNEYYNCALYYKMQVDLVPNKEKFKTEEEQRDLAGLQKVTNRSHLLMAETYSKRYYRRPAQVQEFVEASRFSGFEKTYFTNLVTSILPFHVYDDYIRLNEKDYVHPVSAGWQSRYEFDLLDEVTDGKDTTYILKYRPKKNAAFEALWGTVYIHTDGFAISHIMVNTANPKDTTASRYVKMEQIYSRVNGKWFPRELNYELVFKEYPSPQTGMLWQGHGKVDSVSFTPNNHIKFDKARSVILTDSVDRRNAEQWNTYRSDTLSVKEQNTYVFIDSISKKLGLEKIMNGFRNISRSRISIGPLDYELKRLLSYNTFEGTRIGLGVYTNDKISKYISVGGWFGYGFGDKRWKYGASARFMPGGQKDNWLEVGYQDNYKNTGSIIFHRELDETSLRQFTLAQVDRIQEYSATVHKRAGYWELELAGLQHKLQPFYTYSFTEAGTNGTYDLQELSASFRYSFGEIRTPAFGYYLPTKTKYPIFYLKLSGGNLSSGTYETKYVRSLAAVTYNVHINRWGRDNYRLEAGAIHSLDDKALPRSYLLAGNGYKMNKDYQFYTDAGFLTMLPYQYFSDGYVSLLYRHDFDRALFRISDFSKPTVSLAHNMLYGTMLQSKNLANNPGIAVPDNGFHESGIILNKLLYYNFMKLVNLNINVGAFYHWAPNAGFDWNKFGRGTIGLTADI